MPRNDETTIAPTKPDIGTPIREEPAPMDDPDRYYNPERLCPDQSKEGTWKSLP